MSTQKITMTQFMDLVGRRFENFSFEMLDEGNFYRAASRDLNVVGMADGTAWSICIRGTDGNNGGTLDEAASQCGCELARLLSVAAEAKIEAPSPDRSLRDGSRIEAFIRRFDEWAFSPELDGGPRFDAMIEARGEIEDLFPAEDSSEGR